MSSLSSSILRPIVLQVHHGARLRNRSRTLSVQAALDPPNFNPSKLKILQVGSDNNNGGSVVRSSSVAFRRRYTLTHNDLTGYLTLSIGKEYNESQLSGWYTKILRDEVLAEWKVSESSDGDHNRTFELHVYCHVSGEEMWPAPAGLRSFIFQREMTLVLETISYADREMILSDPVLGSALVFVHLASDLEPLNKKIMWGRLGDKNTWKKRVSKRSLVDVLFSTDEEDDDHHHAFDDIPNENAPSAATIALKSKE